MNKSELATMAVAAMFREEAGEDGYLRMDEMKALTTNSKHPAVAAEIKKLYDDCTNNGSWGMSWYGAERCFEDFVEKWIENSPTEIEEALQTDKVAAPEAE